jgi:hypothetical protein
MDSLQTYRPAGNDELGDFEAKCEERHRRAMREEMAAEIASRDERLYDASDRVCPSCGGTLHSHGRTNALGFLAVCGEVRARLKRQRCASCGRIVVPGAALVPESGISAALAERSCDLASKMPYAKAAESLLIQHGIKMSPKRFWALVQTEAALIADVLKEEAKELFTHGTAPEAVDLKGEKPLIIGIDGGFLRGWKDNPGFEVKCATVATGSAPGPGCQRHLTDRVGYAALCSTEDFRRRISVLAIKSGYLTAGTRIFVSDGANWIAKMISDYFPEAIHVLDLYHLKHKVQGLFGIRAEGMDADIRDAALDACNTFDPELIVEIINVLWRPPDAPKAAARDDLVAYIENNAQAIRNHRLVNIHGSGWIEKGVDLMVSRRMKNRGMAWTELGSSHIIPFAVLRYNKQWDVYWSQAKGTGLLGGCLMSIQPKWKC